MTSINEALDETRHAVTVESFGLTDEQFDALFDRVADAAHSLDEEVTCYTPDPAEVERLTAERDSARDMAVALEQQNAEALRIVRTAVVAFSVPGTPFRDGMAALRQAIRVLSGDTEEGPAL